jgi:hypothetical protein
LTLFSSSKQISALSARLNIIIHQMVVPTHKELGISFPNSLWHLARHGSVEVELDLVALGGWAVFSTSSEAGEIRVLQKLFEEDTFIYAANSNIWALSLT